MVSKLGRLCCGLGGELTEYEGEHVGEGAGGVVYDVELACLEESVPDCCCGAEYPLHAAPEGYQGEGVAEA